MRYTAVFLLAAVALAGCTGGTAPAGPGNTTTDSPGAGSPTPTVDPVTADDFAVQASYDRIYVHPFVSPSDKTKQRLNRVLALQNKPLYVARDGQEDVLVHGGEERARYAKISFLHVIDGKPAYIAEAANGKKAFVHGEEQHRITRQRYGTLNPGSLIYLFKLDGKPLLAGYQGFWYDGTSYYTGTHPIALSSTDGTLARFMKKLPGYDIGSFLRVAVTDDGVAYVNGTASSPASGTETATATFNGGGQYVVYPDGSTSKTYMEIGGLLETKNGIGFVARTMDGRIMLVRDGSRTRIGTWEASNDPSIFFLAASFEGRIAHHRNTSSSMAAYWGNKRLEGQTSFMPFYTGDELGWLSTSMQGPRASERYTVWYGGRNVTSMLSESFSGRFRMTNVGSKLAMAVRGPQGMRLLVDGESRGDIKYSSYWHPIGLYGNLGYAGVAGRDGAGQWTVVYNETELGTYDRVRTITDVAGNLSYVAVEDGQHKLFTDVQ